MRISDWSSDVCSSDLAFVDELAREIDVGSVLKHDGHLAEAIARNRAGVVEVRDPRDGSLDGEGDALLGLEWRIAFGLGVYLHLHIGDVRHGITLQPTSAPSTQGPTQAHDYEDKPTRARR